MMDKQVKKFLKTLIFFASVFQFKSYHVHVTNVL